MQPRELTLCRVFEDMGRCPLVGCEFAHGHEELAQREKEFECACFWQTTSAGHEWGLRGPLPLRPGLRCTIHPSLPRCSCCVIPVSIRRIAADQPQPARHGPPGGTGFNLRRAAKRAEREHNREEEKNARAELAALNAPERLSSSAQDAMRSFKVGACMRLPPGPCSATDCPSLLTHVSR